MVADLINKSNFIKVPEEGDCNMWPFEPVRLFQLVLFQDFLDTLKLLWPSLITRVGYVSVGEVWIELRASGLGEACGCAYVVVLPSQSRRRTREEEAPVVNSLSTVEDIFQNCFHFMPRRYEFRL